MKNLILSTGCGYPKIIFERFFKSIRQVNCDADIVVIISESDATRELAILFKEYGAKCKIYIDERKKNQVGQPAIVGDRYNIFYDFLVSNVQYSFSKILHIDLRDVFFQKDPFSVCPSMHYELFLAVENSTIGRDYYNKNWLRDGFGEKILKQLSDKRVLCSGTTMGTYRAMLEYFRLMTNLIFEVDPARNDQCVHNVLYYSKLLDSCKPLLLDNKSDLYFTLGLAHEYTILLDKIYNSNRVSPAIVHQFDRLSVCELEYLNEYLTIPFDDLIMIKKELEVDNNRKTV